MLTRNTLIHLRNILEGRINEQYDLFLDLVNSPNTGHVEKVVETLFVSMSENVSILVKVSDAIGCETIYNDQWLERIQSEKEKWINSKSLTSMPGKRRLRTLYARFL